MTPHLQTVIALAAVGLAAAWLVVRSRRKRKQPGCGGDCGCPASDLKAKVREHDAGLRA